MKKLLVVLLLCGCANKTASDSLAESAAHAVNTMYNAVPVECRTQTVTDLRDNSLKQIKAMARSCYEEQQALSAEISKKNAIIFSLCLLILVCVGANMFLKSRR